MCSGSCVRVRLRRNSASYVLLQSPPIIAIWSTPPSAACSVFAGAVPPCSAIATTTAIAVWEYARLLENFHMTDAEWDAFGIPIGLAFFVHSTPDKRIVAFYPGPAGPTESLLDLQAWVKLVANNPLLAELEPDSEALLVNRVRNAREYFQAPIDRCYALVGLIRAKWRGLSGGDEVWKAIDGFFAELREQRACVGAYRHG
jgi:Family of unknown function (DUF5947)